MEKYETLLSEILEVNEINLEDEFESFDAWDSLTILSIIALCESEYKVVVTAEEIDNSETVEGLKNLIVSRMQN